MDIQKYIDRIGFKGNLEVNENCLKELHTCHVMSIPFETIDVQVGEPIHLNIERIYNKVILRNRGGYCYELNLLFHTMLTMIGFDNYLISASIFHNEEFGPEFDHMAIIVELDELWLIDVGYGDLFIEPIKIEPKVQQEDKFKIYRIKETNSNEYILSESFKENIEFKAKYKFKNIQRKANDFDEQNNWKQSSNESYFKLNRICTIPTQGGRKTIFNSTYKVIIDKDVTQIDIDSEEEFLEILKNDFDIDIKYHKDYDASICQ